MDGISVLRTDYPGDDAWESFCATFWPQWLGRNDKQTILDAIPDEQIAAVLSAEMGDGAGDWFVSGIPDLNGLSASAILQSRPDGLKIVRSLLMRLPQ